MTSKLEKIKLKVQAASGNAEALYLLGCDYLYLEQNLELAHRYLQKASSKGFSHATELMKFAFVDDGNGVQLSEDLKPVYEITCKMYQAADKGDPAALHMKNMAKLSDDTDDYMFNRGVSQMQQAADQDYAPALHALGVVYLKGNRIKGKKEEGIKMIVKAAQQEYFPAVKSFANLSPEEAYPLVLNITKKKDAEAEAFSLLSSYYQQGIVVEKNENEAIRLLKIAFEKGDVDAAFILGVTFEHGLMGQKVDIDKAISYYELGVSKDDTNCMNNLGAIYEKLDKIQNGKELAFKLYMKAAELGDAGAYNNIGSCFKRGIGVEVDAQKALDNYLMALEKGDVYRAYWNIYLYYMDDVCVTRDYNKAVEWLIKGDKDGVLQCTYQLSKHYRYGDGVERDLSKMFFYLKKAADAGFEVAFKELADCYRYGIETEINSELAFELYKKASNKDVEALNNLAQCYSNGIGTERNLVKAFELYKIGAESGHAQSQYDLGICYRQGEGTAQDFAKAIEWYEKAIEQGHGGAMCNLGILYDNGIGVEKDSAKAFKYYTMSAESGNKQGQFCLADMYFRGRGVEQNYLEAVKWFKFAAEQGEPDSTFHLAICYNEGLGVEKDPKRAMDLLCKAADMGWQPAIDVIKNNNIDHVKTETNNETDSLNKSFPKVISSKSPREVLFDETGRHYPLVGGWGYDVKDSVYIQIDNKSEGVDFEYWFINYRANKELNGIKDTNNRFAAIQCLNVKQSLRKKDGCQYDVLNYIVKALPIESANEFDAEWKEHNGYKDDPNGLEDFHNRVEEKAVGYKTECWFNISSFFGKR